MRTFAKKDLLEKLFTSDQFGLQNCLVNEKLPTRRENIVFEMWIKLFEIGAHSINVISVRKKATLRVIVGVSIVISTFLLFVSTKTVLSDLNQSYSIPSDIIVEEDTSEAMNIENLCIAVIESDIQTLEPAVKTWFTMAANVTFFRKDPSSDLKTRLADFFTSNNCPNTFVLKGRLENTASDRYSGDH